MITPATLLSMAQPAPAAPARTPGLRPGAGTRLVSTYFGTAVSMPAPDNRRADAFRPSLAGRGISFSRGYVDGRMPTIDERLIVPQTGARPVLTLNASNANKAGESWVCVEVHPDADGKLPPDSKVEIVERNETRSIVKELGRLALCLVLWKDKRPFQVFQLVRMNTGYERVLPPAGGGAVRHLFP